MMTIFKWLRSVWLWLRNKVVYFLPRLSRSKYNHGSDYSSSDEEPICRVPCDSGTGIYDEVDHVPSNGPSIPRSNPIDTMHHASKNNIRDRGEIFQMKNKISPRNGAQADRENIERLLKHAGFESVHVYCDQRRKDTLEIMDHISNSPEIANHDGLVVFLSSHGRPKGILTTDKKIVEVDELTSRVNGKQCVALRGKPKLFFISACRGKKSDPGVPGPITHDAGGDEKLVPRLPTEADFLVCYSTTPDHISHRRFTLGVHNSRKMGTWLISSLTQVFEERMEYEDIMEMLARVNASVADMSSHGDHVDGMKQMPVQMHMLRHRVFFGKARHLELIS